MSSESEKYTIPDLEPPLVKEKDIREMTAKHNAYLKQLGLSPLP